METEFSVQDMSCGGCANSIARAIAGLDPAATVNIDVATKIVKITSTLPATQLRDAIEAAGFHPSVRNE
ncbi:copper chaperone [bacterium M00.F.Ca.ET.228.01.1.1]|uniref:heavy-metal-associated domain-containing protein n=1 Tax=Paraburkholderia phenoliruptrix TaxID=252970 RepID=UPI001092778A|nr:heavy-metal-associated domain-containing protein [Paraburkholderia phenoliruptrix]TGP39612.1 copper chaperone [bacterium M00.F.Ca.ET.228.01.1.1]TGR95445.1 copper chaperone [bacterium M00.F.Ca.ET.191.01.1.1]TGT96371.1 copper chaperone [bacterium M00.F.Ca.ET.155.01.1.1]MBW0450777.1 heavy-metal-associated domain-containing protein [Paraburkholderia phenoliruptrix]MBW9101785.1 heavy-metal-associated domain-containing protein [Paraburkholderia phenoliruptrix]